MAKTALDKIVDDLVEWHNSLEKWIAGEAMQRQDLRNLINKHTPNRLGQLK